MKYHPLLSSAVFAAALFLAGCGAAPPPVVELPEPPPIVAASPPPAPDAAWTADLRRLIGESDTDVGDLDPRSIELPPRLGAPKVTSASVDAWRASLARMAEVLDEMHTMARRNETALASLAERVLNPGSDPGAVRDDYARCLRSYLGATYHAVQSVHAQFEEILAFSSIYRGEWVRASSGSRSTAESGAPRVLAARETERVIIAAVESLRVLREQLACAVAEIELRETFPFGSNELWAEAADHRHLPTAGLTAMDIRLSNRISDETIKPIE